ncbi:aminoacyl-tRNA hydrolase [Paraburkholderia sp. EG287A]|uniref:aminoacyl-tRNA hydrolase n=1 Tax=Paraburkholderia sp. EG287A TaxID=3237012 RepID=UPI0034D1BE33
MSNEERSYPNKQVIVMRKDLNMRKGKMVAQGSHASMAAVLSRGDEIGGAICIPLDSDIGPWLQGRFAKVCVSVSSEAELQAVFEKGRASGLPCAIIKDSGFTEFHGVPTLTAAAIGPGPVEQVDAITGHLPLL